VLDTLHSIDYDEYISTTHGVDSVKEKKIDARRKIGKAPVTDSPKNKRPNRRKTGPKPLTPFTATWRVMTGNYDPNALSLFMEGSSNSNERRIWTCTISSPELAIWRQNVHMPSTRPEQGIPQREEKPKAKRPATWKVVLK